MQFAIAIGFSQEEDELLTGKVFPFESRFGAVKVFDRVALSELPFERLDHFADDSPVFVTADAPGNLSLVNANVGHDRDGFVIAPQVAERGPVVIVLGGQRKRQAGENEQCCEREFQNRLLRKLC